MPIEIKITDISTLTIQDIDDLHSYLINTATRIDWGSATTLPKSESTFEESPPYWTAEEKSTNDKDIKPRNKRKAKVDSAIDQLVKDVEMDTIPPSPPPSIAAEIPQAELVSYVVEHTRTKKLTFDNVMEVLTRFNVINLNSLDQTPHLIGPIFNALKEIVNERT